MKQIIPRRLKLSGENSKNKFQIQNSALISTFYYGFIAGLPCGERLMIETVRQVIDDINDPQFKRDLRGFVGQESHHANAQAKINRDLETHGFKMSLYEEMYEKHFSYMDKLSPKERASIHAAYEHFASVFCAFSLRNISLFDDMEKNHRDMMIWHNIEEIEHKSVMYDLFNRLDGSYKLRMWGLYKAFIGAFKTTLQFQKMMLDDLEYTVSCKDRLNYVSFFWGKKGMGYHALRDFIRYCFKSFHPTDINDEDLIDNWEEKYTSLNFHETKRACS